MKLVRWLSAHDGGATLTETVRQRLVDAWHRSIALWHRAARRLASRGDDGVDLVGRIAEWLEVDDYQESGRTRQWIDAIPAPWTTLPWDSAATVVLGHPAAEVGASAAWRRQVVCLGPGALPPQGRLDNDLPRPAVVVIQPDREGRRIERLPIENIAGRGGYQDDDERGHGVWLSAVSLGRAGIVDAA
jgi:hypothetical protein